MAFACAKWGFWRSCCCSRAGFMGMCGICGSVGYAGGGPWGICFSETCWNPLGGNGDGTVSPVTASLSTEFNPRVRDSRRQRAPRAADKTANSPGSDMGGDKGLSGKRMPFWTSSSLLARTDIFLSNAITKRPSEKWNQRVDEITHSGKRLRVYPISFFFSISRASVACLSKTCFSFPAAASSSRCPNCSFWTQNRSAFWLKQETHY